MVIHKEKSDESHWGYSDKLGRLPKELNVNQGPEQESLSFLPAVYPFSLKVIFLCEISPWV